jgi:hypothetical protein
MREEIVVAFAPSPSSYDIAARRNLNFNMTMFCPMSTVILFATPFKWFPVANKDIYRPDPSHIGLAREVFVSNPDIKLCHSHDSFLLFFIVYYELCFAENKKASKGYRAPLEAFALALSGNPLLA